MVLSQEFEQKNRHHQRNAHKQIINTNIYSSASEEMLSKDRGVENKYQESSVGSVVRIGSKTTQNKARKPEALRNQRVHTAEGRKMQSSFSGAHIRGRNEHFEKQSVMPMTDCMSPEMTPHYGQIGFHRRTGSSGLAPTRGEF